MASYILKRLLLMIPTLFGVLLLTFAVIQFVPGGPVEQMVSQLQGRDSGGERASSGGGYRGRQGLDPIPCSWPACSTSRLGSPVSLTTSP